MIKTSFVAKPSYTDYVQTDAEARLIAEQLISRA
jgi:hypothetical protein